MFGDNWLKKKMALAILEPVIEKEKLQILISHEYRRGKEISKSPKKVELINMTFAYVPVVRGLGEMVISYALRPYLNNSVDTLLKFLNNPP